MDLRQVFTDVGADIVPTETILGRLHDIEDAPWGDIYGKPLDARGLARRLKQYDNGHGAPIRPHQRRTAGRVAATAKRIYGTHGTAIFPGPRDPRKERYHRCRATCAGQRRRVGSRSGSGDGSGPR